MRLFKKNPELADSSPIKRVDSLLSRPRADRKVVVRPLTFEVITRGA